MQLTTYQHNHTVYQYITSKQFKSRVLTIRFLSDLNNVNPTERHIMINMLKAKNAKTKTRKAQSKHLESLYDSMLYTHASKLGTQHVLQITFLFIDDTYTIEKNLLNEVLYFLKTTLYEPLFDQQSLDEEKQFLKDYFKAEYTNKTRYAQKQYIKHLYKDYPYKTHALGDEQKIDQITLDDITKCYDEMMQESRIFISFLSNNDPKRIHPLISNTINLNSVNDSFTPLIKYNFKPLDTVKETLDVSQNRLFMTLKSDVYMKDKNYFTMLVFNAMLGEGSDSLLFKTIREDASLAYYVYSSYSPFTGLVTMTCGMHSDNVEQGKILMLDVVNRLKSGDFTEEDLELAKTHLLTNIKQGYDHPISLSLKALRYALFDIPFEEETLIHELETVTKESVLKLASDIRLIFTYELGGAHENH